MFQRIAVILLLFFTTIQAYQDYDIDGVDDTIDRCPNTSFDVIVDEFGCDLNKKEQYYGNFSLQIGTQLLQDESYENNNALNLFANYRYKNWDISLSNLRTTTVGSFTEDNFNSSNDVYLSTGYFFKLLEGDIKLSVGTRFLSDISYEKKSTNRPKKRRRKNKTNPSNHTISLDNDYFASIHYSYKINQKQNLFLFTGYTITADSDMQTYEDYAAFSLGTGYSIHRAWYSAIAYNYVGSIYKEIDAEESLSWFNSYTFTDNLFATATYRYALDDLSYDHTLLLTVGVMF